MIFLARAQKKRFLGPGTMAMLIGVICFISWQALKPAKVQIERRIVASGEMAEARLPAVLQLLNWRSELGLTEKQFEQIRLLHHEQQSKLAAVEAQISEIMSQIQSGANSASQNPVHLSDLEFMAKQLAQPSKSKREIEKHFSKQAFAILSNTQKGKAVELGRLPSKATQVQKENRK